MPSTRDIRRRIKSVKNTRQITKAMELVAASKMKKAQQAALAGQPYAQLLADMLAAITARVDESLHPFLIERPVKTRGVLLITTNMGLCGALNGNLFKLVTDIKTPAKFVALGRKGSQFLARTKRALLADFTLSDRASFAEVRPVVEFMVKQYLEGEIDTIEVIHSHFKNTLVQEPVVCPVLPLSNLKDFIEHHRSEGSRAAHADDREMLFEPDPHQVLEALLPFYVNRHFYQLVLSSRASEFSARMVAMKTAKDNASKLLDDLTLEYNKARQASITNEILEISASQLAQSA